MLYLEKPRQIDWCCGCSVHEAIGVVVSVKGEDAGFKEGDQVLALPSNVRRLLRTSPAKPYALHDLTQQEFCDALYNISTCEAGFFAMLIQHSRRS